MTNVVTWLKHAARGVLIWLPLVALYGFVSPWPAGEQALSRYPGQTPIMIASFYHSKSWRDARSNGWVSQVHRTRSYFLFPSVFSHPGVVTVSQDNDDAPVVAEATVPPMVIFLAGAVHWPPVFCLLVLLGSTDPALWIKPARGEDYLRAAIPRRFGSLLD